MSGELATIDKFPHPKEVNELLGTLRQASGNGTVNCEAAFALGKKIGFPFNETVEFIEWILEDDALSYAWLPFGRPKKYEAALATLVSANKDAGIQSKEQRKAEISLDMKEAGYTPGEIKETHAHATYVKEAIVEIHQATGGGTYKKFLQLSKVADEVKKRYLDKEFDYFQGEGDPPYAKVKAEYYSIYGKLCSQIRELSVAIDAHTRTRIIADKESLDPKETNIGKPKKGRLAVKPPPQNVTPVEIVE